MAAATAAARITHRPHIAAAAIIIADGERATRSYAATVHLRSHARAAR
jgi:hypothetical protein